MRPADRPPADDPDGLRLLFLDMNGFFASVEQQLRPELRHRPVAVAPLENVDSTAVIAASYEARPFGVKTGVMVRDARRLCPGLVVVPARPEVYIAVHHRIRAAAETCLHVDRHESIDEMHGRLMGDERRPENAVRLGFKVKSEIRRQVGNHLFCSVGIAPNRLLAKVASKLDKVAGLSVIRRGDLPDVLHPLALTDLPGIARRIEARLNAAGIGTVADLCAASERHLHDAWGSVVGRMWHHWLRGDEWHLPPARRSSLGHSHVLPPEFRTAAGAEAVMTRLIHKAAARLRAEGRVAGRMHVYVSFTWKESGWGADVPLGQTQSTTALLRAFSRVWPRRPAGAPTQVGVTLHDLRPVAARQWELFDGDRPGDEAIDAVLDAVNARYGRDTLYAGGMMGARHTAPVRIAFGQIPDVAPVDRDELPG